MTKGMIPAPSGGAAHGTDDGCACRCHLCHPDSRCPTCHGDGPFTPSPNTAESFIESAMILAEPWQEQVDALTAENAELRAMRHRVVTLHVWTDEEGRRFVYADDLLAAVDGGAR